MGIFTGIQRVALQNYIDAGAPEMPPGEEEAWADRILQAQIAAAGPEMQEFMDYRKAGDGGR